MKSELRFESMIMRCADLGSESSVPDLLGERILQNHLEFRLDEDDEIYEGYGRRKNAYPYRQYNEYTRPLNEKEVKTAILENDYLKAVFLPEYGGRLWELWDKEKGINLLYTNDVLRFCNLAVRNAWFSGGVEWNIGIIGHNPYTVSPLYTARTELQDHTPVLRMYEYERIRRVPYQMDFWLKENDRFLNCRMRIVNESNDVIPMYWWSNIAVPEYEGGRITVPADRAFTYSDGMVFKVDVPMVQGIDITDYKKISKSVDYFFDIPQENPKYIANLNKDGYGLLHISTDRLRSRKLFSWGNRQASDHWQEFLTDQGGRYVEIQAGLGKTQYGCIPMAPHTAWEWMEKYGPVQLDGNISETSLRDRAEELTQRIRLAHVTEEMDVMIKETLTMAKSPACLIMPGSGYGALDHRNKLSSHLKFVLNENALKDWKQFFETGILHQPEPSQIPDAFLIDDSNIDFLAQTLDGCNKDNWYAHYHAGIGYFVKEAYDQAEKAFRKSWDIAQNPWVCHALGCLYLIEDEKDLSAKWMCRGLEMEHEEVGYLKEAFKILTLAQAFDQICKNYELLNEHSRQIGKLKFYYINALDHLGQNQEAYDLLEENGGLFMEDVREGEDSLAALWKDLYEKLHGGPAKIPYRYDFQAF